MKEPIPEWAQQLQLQFTELEQLLFDVPILRDKTKANSDDFQKIHKIIYGIKQNTNAVPQILQLAMANFTKCEELSNRIAELEKTKTNCPYCIQPTLNVVT
jgi:hypothetical protein